MAKHSTIEELRAKLVGAVVGAQPADALGQIHIQSVAKHAGISASTLNYHFTNLAGLRLATHRELIGRMCCRPNDDILDGLEEGLRSNASPDQLIANYMRESVTQLATDPAFTYLIGGARQEANPEIVASCNRAFLKIGQEFARPLRIALAAVGLDLSSWGDKAIADIALLALIGGSMSRFLFGEESRQLDLRGVTFEIGGAMLATSLWLLLDIKDPTVPSAAKSVVS